MKICKYCGLEIEKPIGRNNQYHKECGEKVGKEKQIGYSKKYNSKPENKENRRKYNQLPEVKKKRKIYMQKHYNSLPLSIKKEMIAKDTERKREKMKEFVRIPSQNGYGELIYANGMAQEIQKQVPKLTEEIMLKLLHKGKGIVVKRDRLSEKKFGNGQ